MVIFVQNFAPQFNRTRSDGEEGLGLQCSQPGENTENPSQENVKERSIKTTRVNVGSMDHIASSTTITLLYNYSGTFELG